MPGGVTLPAEGAEDAGTVQTIGARFAHGMISLDYAAEMGCKACGSSGGGCQFLGTAATSQVVAEALGMTLPHAVLWCHQVRRSGWITPGARPLALLTHEGGRHDAERGRDGDRRLWKMPCWCTRHLAVRPILLLHIPAIAHAAGLAPPTVDDWIRVNRSTPSPGGCPAEWTAQPSHCAGLYGGWCAGGNVPFARARACLILMC